MPVPGRRLEAEMLPRREIPGVRSDQADGQEDRANDDVEAVEAGRHEEGRAVDAALKVERRVIIFPALDRGEQEPEQDSADQPLLKSLAVAMQQGVMRPGHGGAGA